MSDFYDALETRSPAEREAALLAALPQQVAHAQAHAPAFGRLLAGVDAATVCTREALARLPVTRKYELLEQQKRSRAEGGSVFGGFSAIERGARMRRVFASPGTIYEPEGTGQDYWRVARAIYASGFRTDELIHNSFSYHFVPAGSMMETGAHALGCSVFPGGTGQTEQQVQAMAELQPAGYIGTPSFLKIIVEKAAELGVALPSVKKAMFGGEAFPPSLRDWFLARGIDGYQCYATADLGLIAYETSAREGLVLDEGVIVEIVRPGTGDPVPEGDTVYLDLSAVVDRVRELLPQIVREAPAAYETLAGDKTALGIVLTYDHDVEARHVATVALTEPVRPRSRSISGRQPSASKTISTSWLAVPSGWNRTTVIQPPASPGSLALANPPSENRTPLGNDSSRSSGGESASVCIAPSPVVPPDQNSIVSGAMRYRPSVWTAKRYGRPSSIACVRASAQRARI